VESHHRTKEGRIFPVEITVNFLEFGGNEFNCAFARDITERKHAEKALRQEEEKFRVLVEESPLGISFTGEDGKYKYINPKFIEIFGYTLEDIPTGKEWFKKAYPDSEYRHQVISTWINDYKESKVGESRPRTFKVTCKDGSEKITHFRSVTLETGDHFVIYEDITNQERLEDQLRQAQKMEALGTLAGGIAHDFNNLLMGIQGRTSIMLMDIDSYHPHSEHLKGIEDYVKSAADLTKQLLGLARGGKYEVKPMDLNELINKSSKMFGRTKKEITIHRKNQKDIWTVEVDRSQIEQLMLNLYVNAWQSMPSGGELYLATENVILDPDYVKPFNVTSGKYVKVSITDTGVGMDKATQQRIFDPFFTTKEMGRGSGLGLSSVYGIIKNHGGFINVYSEIGKGTTFNIYLPGSEKKVIEEKILSEEVLKGTETVLLVDDEEMITGPGGELLEEIGYRVLIAGSGKEAIELYEKNRDQIDLVILDMIMPVMGGGETYDKLKETNPDIKVLLSSGYSINGEASEILDRGCSGFIQKPFNVKELSRRIREILDKKYNRGRT
jgi:PAS domain S-box-containing protein